MHLTLWTQCIGFLRAAGVRDECIISTTKFHRSEEGMPSMRKKAYKDMTSDSVELCETAICFLHIRFKVRLPKMHKIPPVVDLESSRSLVKSES